jgi:hypothetical protein
MSDLVERLRVPKYHSAGQIFTGQANSIALQVEAADEIERLRKDVERYRWLRDRIEVRNLKSMAGTTRPGLSVRVGRSYFDSKCNPNRFADELDIAIDAALAQK